LSGELTSHAGAGVRDEPVADGIVRLRERVVGEMRSRRRNHPRRRRRIEEIAIAI
jgi:KaiC/GvpD/RAD55 family RecA-like ATPase